MKTIKFCIVAVLLAGILTGVDAATLSPDEALSRVRQRGFMKSVGTSATNLQLVYTQEDADAVASCYVFGDTGGRGYLVVSADDLVPALLGYSDTGVFNADAMPDALRYWLEAYASQIQWVRSHATTAPVKAVTRPQRDPIKPLVTTRWNQDAPYNDQCPDYEDKRCVTGCVATSMAQAMKYHNWPTTGTGSHSYDWKGQTLSMDYATTTFDWANMTNSYDDKSTEAQKEAVATLMKACGVSVDMAYDPGDSGAVQSKMAPALFTYFGYSKGIYSATRDFYGLLDWEQLIYNNLKDCGPVVYGGQSIDGGHSFICDGYSSDGYFHINWGWGGMSDGYFLLTALAPGAQGIGGSTSGFNFSQDAIIGIKKPVEGEADDYHYIMGSTSDLKLGEDSTALGKWVTVKTAAYNYSPVSIAGKLGMKIESLSTGTVTYGGSTSFEDSPLPPYDGFGSYHFTVPADTPEGEYILTPAFCEKDGKWQAISFSVGCTRNIKMTVKGNEAIFSEEAPATVTISDITPTTKIYVDREYSISATITNPTESEFLGETTAVLIDTNDKIVAVGEAYPIDLLGGESTAMVYVSKFTELTVTSSVVAKGGAAPRRTLAAGTYQLAFANGEIGSSASADASSHTYLSDKVNLQVEANPGAATLTVSDLKFADGNTSHVNPYTMDLTAEVDCTAGYASKGLTLYIFHYPEGGGSVSSLTSDPLYLSAGESKQITFQGRFSNGEPGKKYFCEVYDGEKWVGNTVVFTLADIFTGNVTPDIDKEISDVVIYTLGGTQLSVDTDNLAPGLYIIVTKYTDGTTMTSKVIKR